MMGLAIRNNETDVVDAYWKQLRSLSLKAKLQLATMLTTAALEEECLKDGAKPTRRVAKVIRRAEMPPTDAELQTRFDGLEVPEVPEDPEWSQVISANMGKTIKPIEKWL